MKRGSSDLSLVVGVDKPQGMTSHDVVNRCRRIFGERRVGHTGTLDPLASGAMVVCVGPATRLDAYLVDHDKRYRVRIAFGTATDTDDAFGQVTQRGLVRGELFDQSFAESFVAGLVGVSKQMPPVYSALKVGGKKACDEAREGRIIKLVPRDIEVYEARLIGMGTDFGDDSFESTRLCALYWDVELHVSKGTYIRSIARDAGRALGVPAHVAALRRLSVGSLSIDECTPLDALESVGVRSAIDPIQLLGFRFAFADAESASRIANGAPLGEDALELCVQRYPDLRSRLCACTSGVCPSSTPPTDSEVVSIVVENKLAALYAFNASKRRFEASCVFQKGVSRGEYL